MTDDADEMDEPTQCEACGEWYDAALPYNWNARPFYVQCPVCDHKMRPEIDNYADL